MLMGKAPFTKANEQDIDFWNRVIFNEVEFLNNVNISNEAKNFITNLLKKQPNDRLGFGKTGWQDVKDHFWFNDIKFDDYLKK